MTRVDVVQGDLTREDTEAIVNAANSSLLGGGGVDGAIHRAAGPELLFECELLGGCATGEAKLTRGYRLKAPFVIHTVGPVWTGGRRGEAGLLRDCYTNALGLALRHVLRSISFPAISTGAYRFPKQQAAVIAWTAVHDFLQAHPDALDVVRFVCFDAESHRLYQALKAQGPGAPRGQ